MDIAGIVAILDEEIAPLTQVRVLLAGNRAPLLGDYRDQGTATSDDDCGQFGMFN